MKKAVLFITEGNSLTGWGHAIRCSAISQIISTNFDTYLLNSNFDIPTFDFISNSFSFTINSLKEINVQNCIVLIDRKSLNNTFIIENGISRNSLIIIDDLYKTYDCHSIINHSISATPLRYDNSTFKNLYLGPSYALLRPPFLQKNYNSSYKKNILNFLVCVGGTDTNCFSYIITKTILEFFPKANVSIVIGLNPELKQKLMVFQGRVSIYEKIDAQEMCKLICFSDLAVTSASTLSYECCAVGIGLITGYYTEDQVDFCKSLKDKKLSLSVGNFNINLAAKLARIFSTINPIDINNMIKVQNTVFPNHIRNNILDIFLNIKNT